MPTVTTQPRHVSWSDDHMYFVIESDKFSGTSAPYVPTHQNLSCYIEVWELDRETNENRMLVSLDVPYDPYTKSAVVDVRSLQPIGAHLPDASATDGVATSSLGLIYIKYSDKFGSPAVPDTLVVDNNANQFYVTIYGSTRISIKDLIPNYGFQLHSYRVASNENQARRKEITEAQPDWIYFYIGANKDVEIQTKIFYTDGTDEIKTKTLTLIGKKIHWISSSYADRVGTVTKKVESYTVFARITAPDQFLAAVSYKVVPCIENEKYLAFFNGMGGIESVRMTGERSTDMTATREKYMRPEYGKVERSVGIIGSYNNTGQLVYNFNSGYLSEDEAYHLRQLLLTDAWIIDTNESPMQFQKVSPVSSEIKQVRKERHEDDALHFIEISYEDSKYTTSAVARKI